MSRQSSRAWQRMLSGRRLDILDPSPVDVELADIAHGLARVARWNGQTIGDYPFSVAQHSVLVLELFRASNQDATPVALLQALLHDAPEYVMGDIISPFKAAMGGNGSAITLHEPAVCVIRVRGALSSDWSDRLGGLRISVLHAGRHTITELAGRLADQAALHGALATLYELGMPLLSVECTPNDCPPSA